MKTIWQSNHSRHDVLHLNQHHGNIDMAVVSTASEASCHALLKPHGLMIWTHTRLEVPPAAALGFIMCHLEGGDAVKKWKVLN
jgi:hypothetical protein